MVWLDEDINNRLMLLSYQYTSQQFFMNSKRDGDNEHEEDIESGDSLLLENNMLVIKINVTESHYKVTVNDVALKPYPQTQDPKLITRLRFNDNTDSASSVLYSVALNKRAWGKSPPSLLKFTWIGSKRVLRMF